MNKFTGKTKGHEANADDLRGLRGVGVKALVAGAVALAVLQAEAAQTNPGRVLDEIIVTAQKRTESMQDVPVAVTAVGAQELADAGISDVQDLAMQVPSLVVTGNISPISSSFRIRGIGNEGNIPTFEPAVGLFIDGAFKSRSGFGLGDLVDVQSIEVLKGPQSTLYGKNVTAGVISVSTKAPDQEFDASVEATGGSDGLAQIKAGINIPISDGMATRWSVVGTRRDDLQKNISGPDGRNLDQLAVRGQLGIELGSRAYVRLIGSYANRDMNSTMADVYYSQSHLNIAQTMRNQLGRGEMGPNDPFDNQVNQTDNYTYEQDYYDFAASLEYAFDAVTLNILGAYEYYDVGQYLNEASQLPYEIVTVRLNEQGESTSFELRLSNNNDGRLTWIGGLFYFHNDYTRGDSDKGEFQLLKDVEEYGSAVVAELARNIFGDPTAAIPIFDDQGNVVGSLLPGTPLLGLEGDTGFFRGKQRTDSYGAFLHGTFSLAESLELVGGIRYSLERKKASFTNRPEVGAGQMCSPEYSSNTNFICLLTPLNSNYVGDDKWQDLTGTLSMSWFPIEGSLLYATVSSGFKAGGFNLEFGHFDGENDRKYDKETVTHFELGAKSDLLERRLRLNAAVFRTVYEGYQNATFLGLQYAVNNAEEVLVKGAELEATYLLGEHLTLMAAGTYLDTRYKEYKGGPCSYNAVADNGEFCIADGERTPFASRFSGNFIAQWEQPLFNGDVYARAAYMYTGGRQTEGARDPRLQRGSYGVVDARIGWRNAAYDISVWGKNLGDEVYVVQAAAANIMTGIDKIVGSPEGSYQVILGEPRAVGVTLRMVFP